METKIKTFQKFDEFPFIEDRLVCGINAFIDVMEIPVEKLTRAIRSEIAEKLMELSTSEKVRYNSLYGQSVQFQAIMDVRCSDNEELEEKIIALCEEKFKNFLSTGEYY